MLVLTCGTNGSYVFTDDGLTSFQDTPKVEVADTVGAGDSFTGSFCACILNGKPVQDAHKTAVQVSAFVCTHGLTSFQDTPKVEVADTVGAGDSFTGSFCACILNGKPVQDAHKTAVQVSAFVCTQNGAMPIVPEKLKA